MSDGVTNIRLIRFRGDKTGEPVVHAPGQRGLLLRCNDVLVGASVYRVHENVSCVDCLALEES